MTASQTKIINQHECRSSNRYMPHCVVEVEDSNVGWVLQSFIKNSENRRVAVTRAPVDFCPFCGEDLGSKVRVAKLPLRELKK